MTQEAIRLLQALTRDRRGVAAAEWAVLAGAIVIAVAASVPGIKSSLNVIYNVISTALNT